MPNILKVWTVTLSEAEAEYNVRVDIAKNGTGNDKKYAEYLINSVAGTATQLYRYDDVLASYIPTTTTTAPTTTTVPTATTTKSTTTTLSDTQDTDTEVTTTTKASTTTTTAQDVGE